MNKLLVVEDEVITSDLLRRYFEIVGYEVLNAQTGREALKLAEEHLPRVIILDIMLPDMDGYDVCRKLRSKEKTKKIPIVFLTQKDDRRDKLEGLELGADDYLAKPFEPRELVARIRSVLKRSAYSGLDTDQEIGTQSGLTLIPGRKEAVLGKDVLDLTTMEYDLLELLVRRKGRILNRDFIMEALKGYEWEVFDRSIDVAVSRLRSKLGDSPTTPIFIKTVRGAGYMFIG